MEERKSRKQEKNRKSPKKKQLSLLFSFWFSMCVRVRVSASFDSVQQNFDISLHRDVKQSNSQSCREFIASQLLSPGDWYGNWAVKN
jgi:hypothetical protein